MVGYWPRCVYGLHPNLELGQYAAKYWPNTWSIIDQQPTFMIGLHELTEMISGRSELKLFLVFDRIPKRGAATLRCCTAKKIKLPEKGISVSQSNLVHTKELECKITLTKRPWSAHFFLPPFRIRHLWFYDLQNPKKLPKCFLDTYFLSTYISLYLSEF